MSLRSNRPKLLHSGFFLLSAMFFVGCSSEDAKPAPPAPPEVTVAAVVQQDVPIYNEWIAQLSGPVNAEITPKVQGYLLKQNYQNGYFVKTGQLLFELDPRQYQASGAFPGQSSSRLEAIAYTDLLNQISAQDRIAFAASADKEPAGAPGTGHPGRREVSRSGRPSPGRRGGPHRTGGRARPRPPPGPPRASARPVS